MRSLRVPRRPRKSVTNPSLLSSGTIAIRSPAVELVADTAIVKYNGVSREWIGPVSKTQVLLLNLSTIPIMFLAMLDAAIISTAIPQIVGNFHSVLDIGWYGAAYQLANASLQPLAGKLYTYFPSKITFLTFFSIFEFGSLVCGAAQSSNMLIAGRAIAGLGASGLTNGVLAMVAASVPMPQRPAIIGLGMGVSQIGIVLGPVVGGILTQKASWRWCFYMNLPAGVVFVLPLLFIGIPDPNENASFSESLHFIRDKLDLTGLFLLAPGVTMLLVAIQYGSNHDDPWNSPRIIGLLGGALAALIMFFWATRYKGDNAILPCRIVRRRIVWCSCLVMTFSVATTFCATYFLPLYFQTVRGATPIASAIYLLPTIIPQLLSAVASGFIVSKTGYYLPWSVCGSAMLAVGSGLISTYSPTTPLKTWVAYQILLGFGRGIGMQMPIIALQHFLPEKDISVGTSFIMFGHTMGGAVFLSIAQTIFVSGLRALVPVYSPGTDPETVIQIQVQVHQAAGGELLAASGGVLMAISKSISRVFYMTAGAGVGAFVFALGIGWRDIRKTKLEHERGLIGEGGGDATSGG